MAGYKASKMQQKALTALSIEYSQYITYTAAGELLAQAGWSRDGREQVVRDENYAGHYSNYSEYR